MSVANFLTHIKAQSPTFHCYACGDKTESLSLVAQISHSLRQPADLTAVQLIREYLGPDADRFVELYSEHDGLTLYRDHKGDAEGLRLYTAEDWEPRTQEMKDGFSAMGFAPDECPSGVLDSLAFGEIPHSGNYFSVKVSGPDRGSIFYADHDDFTDTAFAKTLEEFLTRIVDDPAQFLYDVGCYTRYSDGKSSTQWIPKQFQSESK